MSMTTATNVSTYFTLYGILGVDEKAQLLITFLWLNYWWVNEYVSWDPVQCGTNKISLPRDKFWVPDIVINEFMDENTAPKVPYVYLYSTGVVHDAKPVRVVSSCNLDIYTFPFDIQNCTLTFNSYLHYSTDIEIFLGKTAENITKYSKQVITTMGEWELLDITSHKNIISSSSGPHIDELVFHIRVRRRATLYVVNLLIPSCFLITVDLFSFLLPPQAVDRSSFKMTLILGYTVFLLIMNDLLPITGNTIPLINVFFSLCLALMVASLLETILVTNLLSCSANFSSVPRWVQVFVLQILALLVCMPRKTKETKGSGKQFCERDMKLNTVVAQQKAADGLPGEKGPAVDSMAVQELRSLGRDLQAIRLHVEQQQGDSKSSEEWIQCRLLKVKPPKLLFIFISVLMHAPCSSLMVNCSQPDLPSLLEALTPVFTLSSIRPVMNTSTPTRVSIDFTMYGILGVDEKAQILTTYIWQDLTWRNEFVEWDPEQCGSAWITIPRKLLWTPDVVINECMEQNSAPFVPYTYVYHDGFVYDGQPVRVVSSCRLDIYTFPFDTQNCSFTFNSYLLRMAAMEIRHTLTAEEILQYSKDVMATMGEWYLVGLTAETLHSAASDGEAYQFVRFFVSVKRRSTLYVVNLLIPSCLLITVDLFSFLLSPHSGDRSFFKVTLILGYTVFLLIMNDLLPVSGDRIPLMNVFLCLCLALMMTSLLETILITNLLFGSAHYSPVPRWVRVFVLHILGRLVWLPPKSRMQETTVIQNPAAQDINVPSRVEENNEAPEQKGPLDEDKALQELRSLGRDLEALKLQMKRQLSAEEWIQVGFIIDRLLFLLYILFISASFITIIFFWLK
ncbi:5-hydroxytryptamine receptor 3C-like isoform X2 [Acanthopagrus latus]|nr:5-hydroxytryptamine receptor 3C-like isoform X2 [Acanthopagrus latus]